MVDFTILSTIQERVSWLTDPVLDFFNLNFLSGKIISFLIIAVIIYTVIKIAKPLVKGIIILLSILLACQVGLSFLPIG